MEIGFQITANMESEWDASICSVPDDHIDPRRMALFMAEPAHGRDRFCEVVGTGGCMLISWRVAEIVSPRQGFENMGTSDNWPFAA